MGAYANPPNASPTKAPAPTEASTLD